MITKAEMKVAQYLLTLYKHPGSSIKLSDAGLTEDEAVDFQDQILDTFEAEHGEKIEQERDRYSGFAVVDVASRVVATKLKDHATDWHMLTSCPYHSETIRFALEVLVKERPGKADLEAADTLLEAYKAHFKEA